MLPDKGNGTYKLYAYADDRDGYSTLLGTRTITCSNASATKPFGALDTPEQGATVSGNAYVNFGWALTPLPKVIPTDGLTITLFVDGIALGHPVYNQFRSDIANAFPGLNNSNGPVGYFMLDTTKLSNGLHTIVWVVSDSGNASEGIGSRYFTTANGASALAKANDSAWDARHFTRIERNALTGTRRWTGRITWRRGYDIEAPFTELDAKGLITSRPLDRIEVRLRDESAGTVRLKADPTVTTAPATYRAYLLVGDELRPLPTGSTFDPRAGTLTWQPGVGFIGQYDFLFVRTDRPERDMMHVTIVLQP